MKIEICLDVDFIQEVGIRAAMFYTAVQKFPYDSEGRHCASIKEVETLTTLSKFIQWKMGKKLQDMGYIRVDHAGIPPQRRIKVLK